MKYTDFFLHEICEGENCNEYTGDTFSAPQPDFDTYDDGKEPLDPYPEPYKEKMEKMRKLEEISALLEKNIPTNPSKWAAAKAAAKRKFKVYPSAYANLWAAKKYKSMGGGWKKGKK